LRLDGLQHALQEALEQQGLTLGEEFSQRLGEQRTALARVEEDLRALEADVANLRAQMDEELYRLANLVNEQAAALAWRIGELETAVNERLDAQVTGLTEQLAQVEAELVEQRQLLEQQGTALVQADAQFLQEIQSLRQDVQTLRQRTDALERYVLANEAAINLLRQDLEAALAREREEREALRREVADLQTAVRE